MTNFWRAVLVAVPAMIVSVAAGYGVRALLDDNGWQSMASAPRDGTVIEIRNDYGVMSSYGLYRWSSDGIPWLSATQPMTGYGHDMEQHLRWRAYSGDPTSYDEGRSGVTLMPGESMTLQFELPPSKPDGGI